MAKCPRPSGDTRPAKKAKKTQDMKIDAFFTPITPVPVPEIALSEKQKDILHAALHEEKNIFFTRAAGTVLSLAQDALAYLTALTTGVGKSLLLRVIINALR